MGHIFKSSVISILSISSLFSIEFEPLDIHGETNYERSSSESLITKLFIDYKLKLHEPSHKKYLIYIGGNVNFEVDHFGNNVKENVFTTIGIDF